MAEALTHRTYQLPPKLKIPLPMDEDGTKQLVYSIIDDAYERAYPKIDKGLALLDEKAINQLQKQAESEGQAEASDYLRKKLQDICAYYIGYRTNLVQIREEDTQRNVTVGYISNALTDISDCIGLNTTEQIYRTLTTALDEELDRRYGKKR